MQGRESVDSHLCKSFCKKGEQDSGFKTVLVNFFSWAAPLFGVLWNDGSSSTEIVLDMFLTPGIFSLSHAVRSPNPYMHFLSTVFSVLSVPKQT